MFFKYSGDLQIQVDGSAEAARRMMLRQARTIGFPFWHEAIMKHGEAPGLLDVIDITEPQYLERRFREQLRIQQQRHDTHTTY